ncbi:MAG: hypothetical protein ACXABY_33785, partial [Candidatus Thorarchaeota archaeon]
DPAYDVDEIEDALQERMDRFEEAIVEMGGGIGEKFRIMARVKEENFGWKLSSKFLSPLDTIDPEKIPAGFVEEAPIDILRAKKLTVDTIEELFL